ncbi:MAG: DUF6265 family protein [Flavobacteriaceae bacterium]
MRNLLFALLVVTLGCKAQNTMSLQPGATSPKADLTQVAWMEGHWKGEAFGGITEEIWGPPLGGSMMFVFKLVNEGAVSFYEIGHFREVDSSLVFELKHFDGELKGWEEKEEVQIFKLVKIEGNRAYFDGFTFENVSENEINIYGLMEHDDGTSEEVIFNYQRQ